MASKRIVAEVPDDFFWELKAKAADMKLSQKELIIIALRKTINSKFPVEQLFDNEETICKIRALKLDEEN